MQTFITAYPWDLVDDRLDESLDRLKGEIGINGIAVWLTAPRLLRLRARNFKTRLFRTAGGVLFHACDEMYEGTRCKPISATWAKSKDAVGHIADACKERGLDFRAIVSASRTGRIATRQPEMACKNLFGDPSEESLCLSNPDVQSFLAKLVEDAVSCHGFDGVALADFQTYWAEASNPTLQAPFNLGHIERCLLGLCFCESCRQRAEADSVDVEAARKIARELLEQYAASRPAGEDSYATLLESHPALSAYQTWRGGELLKMLASLRESSPCSLRIERRLSGVERSMQGGMQCQDDDVLTVLTAKDAPSFLDGVVRSRVNIRIPSDLVTEGDTSPLVSAFSKVSEKGVESIEIADYGMLSDSSFDAIRQGIRIARRSTSS